MKVPFFSATDGLAQEFADPFAVRSVGCFVDPKEAIALSNYAGDRGLDPDGELSTNIHNAIAARDTAESQESWLKANVDLVRAYTRLRTVTAPNNVTGRTVIDSHEYLLRHTAAEWSFGLICLAGAIATEILGIHYSIEWTNALAVSGESAGSSIYTLYSTALVYLLPFFWGGVGSFIYLIRRLSEYAANRQFSSARLRGSLPRLVLGSVLGGVVANVYGEQANAIVAVAIPDLSTTGGLGASALAFIAGLGVKAVYGAFQAIIDTVTIWVGDLVPTRSDTEDLHRNSAVPPVVAATPQSEIPAPSNEQPINPKPGSPA